MSPTLSNSALSKAENYPDKSNLQYILVSPSHTFQPEQNKNKPPPPTSSHADLQQAGLLAVPPPHVLHVLQRLLLEGLHLGAHLLIEPVDEPREEPADNWVAETQFP